jgi:hypothetical protein
MSPVAVDGRRRVVFDLRGDRLVVRKGVGTR